MEEQGKSGTEEGWDITEKQEGVRAAEGAQGHRGRLFSALPGDECDRHANLADTLPLLNQAPSPAMAPRATKLEPRQEVWGWVWIQTQHRPHCLAQALAISSVPLWDLGVG